MKRIALVGHGGHAKVIKEMIYANKQFEILAFFDDKFQNLDKHEEVYYGPISSISMLMKEIDFKLIIAIGNNILRKKIVEQLRLADDYYESVIHHTAVISESAIIGRGTVIMPNVTINADTTIGSHVIVNTATVVEHDNYIGDFVHICPNSTLTGTVTVGAGTQIGAGTTVTPNLKIGEWSMTGAGATVIHDIPDFHTVVGTPAK